MNSAVLNADRNVGTAGAGGESLGRSGTVETWTGPVPLRAVTFRLHQHTCASQAHLSGAPAALYPECCPW